MHIIMKNTFKLLLSLFIIAGVVVTSCVKDDFDQPEIPNPCDVKSGLVPNITVEGIADLFANLEAVQGSSVKMFPDSNLVLEATVVSSDESGNIYKSLYLEDATGAVVLSIEGTNLFNDYPVGQTVHLNLSKLTVEFDSWVSIHEIGFGTFEKDGAIKGIGRIPVTTLANILKNHSCPKTPTPTVMNLLSFDNSNLGRLVKVEDVQLKNTGVTYADALSNPPQSVSLTVEDCNGNEIVLRNSGYASFAGQTVPAGKGSITGIFTKYGSTYQLLIRDTTDVQLTGARCGESGGNTGGTGTGTFDDPYDVASAIANNSGTGVWVQGFLAGIIETGGTNNVADLTAPFATATNVYIAPTADETDTTKMLIVQLPSGDIRAATNLVDNGNLLGSEIKYHGNLLTYFGVPGLKNTNGYWLIEANTGVDPNAPIEVVVKGTSQVVTSINENFESAGTAGDAWDQNGWLNANMQGERYWKLASYSNNKYAQANAYNANSTDLEMWLVSPGINCDVNKTLSFETKVGYWKHDPLTVYISTDFDGDPSNLSTATWTDITSNFTIPNEPASGYGSSYTPSGNFDMSSYTGQTVYILFKYTGNNSTNTTTMQIDNVVVADL